MDMSGQHHALLTSQYEQKLIFYPDDRGITFLRNSVMMHYMTQKEELLLYSDDGTRMLIRNVGARQHILTTQD
jgi:hypothetical protein